MVGDGPRGTQVAPGGTLVTDVLSGTPCVRRLRVTATGVGADGASAELEVGSLLVGGHKDCDLVIQDPLVSRRHLEIALVADGVRLRDLDSRNGTFIGEHRVAQAIVAPGTEVVVGDTVLTLEALDTPIDLGEGPEQLGELLARSSSMKRLFSLLSRVAPSDVTVLLEGETGVGKDVLARTLHAESARAAGPFLVFDCGAVSPQLIASELFGHAKGAFTGASSDRAGIFEAARGGTVFLDEIGELGADLQPSLLRVLENRHVRRVGETKERPVDVRVIAATHRDLGAEGEAGRFRQDLMFRLAIVRARVPPLRERRDDIPLLVERFLDACGRKRGDLRPAQVQALIEQDWPGNVRQLKNVIEQSAALSGAALELFGLESASGGVAQTGDGGAWADLIGLPWKEAKDELVRRFEREYLEALLKAHAGNISAAARAAGVARGHLHRQLDKHALVVKRKVKPKR